MRSKTDLDRAADRIQRQAIQRRTERVAQLLGDFGKAQKHIGHDAQKQRRHPARRTDQRQGDQQAIKIDGAKDQQRIDIRQRRARDAFTTGLLQGDTGQSGA